MTVKKLKELLENVDDDARIYLDDGYRMFMGNSEVVILAHAKQFPKKIVLQTKADIDVPDELEARQQFYAEKGYDEYDFLLDCGEDGFVLDDFKYDARTYEWVKNISETHEWEGR